LLFAIGYWLFAIRYWLFAIRYQLFAGRVKIVRAAEKSWGIQAGHNVLFFSQTGELLWETSRSSRFGRLLTS
jgi:hypothetical protein